MVPCTAEPSPLSIAIFPVLETPGHDRPGSEALPQPFNCAPRIWHSIVKAVLVLIHFFPP